jgi:putative transposase
VPRQPRAEIESGVYHVYARGNCRQAIYVDDRDRRTYLLMLERVVRRMEWFCLAYCLMDNHVHLLIETRRPNLGVGMQRLHGPYAQRFNHRHRRTGHLFEARFGSKTVGSEGQMWTTVRYILRNPVTAGLCETVESWRWSSHAAVLAGAEPGWVDMARLLSYLEASGGDVAGRYLKFVTAP